MKQKIHTDHILVRCKPEQKQQYESAAKSSQKGMSKWVRETLDAAARKQLVGACCFDTQLRFVDVNEVLADLNGLPREDHLGRTVSEIVPGEGGKSVEVQLRHVLATGQPILGGRVRIAAKLFEHNYYPLKTEINGIVGVSCTVSEVKE